MFLHGGDLAEYELILICLIVSGGFVAITLGLVYLAGYMAKKHRERYEVNQQMNDSNERDV